MSKEHLVEEYDWEDIESIVCNKEVFLDLLKESDFYPDGLVDDLGKALDEDVVVRIVFEEEGGIKYQISDCFAHLEGEKNA